MSQRLILYSLIAQNEIGRVSLYSFFRKYSSFERFEKNIYRFFYTQTYIEGCECLFRLVTIHRLKSSTSVAHYEDLQRLFLSKLKKSVGQ